MTTVAQARDRIVDLVAGYRAAKVLLVAAHYDLFTLVDEGHRTAPAIAQAAGLDLRATQILLSAVQALGLLRQDGDTFDHAPGYRELLVKGQPGYMGNNLKYQELIWDAWSDLREVMKAGHPQKALGDWLFNDAFGAEYIRGMANIARRPAEEIAALFPVGDATAMLDVGAGPGSYSLAFLRRQPKLTAQLLDLPSTVAITTGLLADEPLNARIRFRTGDYHEADFGDAQYDFVLLSHITHDEGPEENARMVQKAFRALKPGGRLIIHDFMTNDANAEVFPALFSVHMLVYTSKGQVYSEREYTGWMTAAGFGDVTRHGICEDTANRSVALVGTKA